MRLSDDGRAIALERVGIPDSDWATIGVTLAESLPRPGRPILVTADQLVARAYRITQILRALRGRLVTDDAVRDVLTRLREDSATSAALLNGGSAGRELPEIDQAARRLTRTLREFQESDVNRLWEMRHGANFSVPGAGKTTVSLALHLRERAARRVDRMLVVGPISAFEAWEEECRAIVDPPLTTSRWSPSSARDTHVVIINYQKLASALPDLCRWMSAHRAHLVVDEAHRVKRGNLGEWGRSIMALAPLATRRDILTGTPAPNHPKDLVALLDIVWPGGAATRMIPRSALRPEPPASAMHAMNDAIAPLYVRTTKEMLALPPVTFVPTPPVPMGPVQKDIYDALLRRYAGLLSLDDRDADRFARMGEVAMYLIQAASSPQLLAAATDPSRSYRFPPLAIPPGSDLARMVESYADHEVPSKIAEACKIVFRNARQPTPRKTLVWSNFPANLLALETQLAGLQPALVYGGIPSMEDAGPDVRNREGELRRFREDPDCLVLLANPAAMAEGVSLHHVCHDAVYIDRTFNAGQYLQSLDRIHRLGLRDDTETRIFLLEAEGTIDARIGNRLRAKVTRLGQLLGDGGLVTLALPDEDDAGDIVDDELDINEVLLHLRGIPG